jgi:hypothetical protein
LLAHMYSVQIFRYSLMQVALNTIGSEAEDGFDP